MTSSTHLLALAAVAYIFVPFALCAQSIPPAKEYKFEVAAIKPSNPKSSAVWLIPDPHGDYHAENVTVWQLITGAYYIRDQQLTGGPAWLKVDRYDIDAKAERVAEQPETSTSPVNTGGYLARHRQRMQALLRDRFGVVLRTETREMSCYALRVSKNGNKMEKADESDGNLIARMGNGSLSMTADTKGIVSMLTDIVGGLVIDETGLPGYYKVKLAWTPENREATTDAPSIFTALNEQLGLRLVSTRAPVPVYVIDSAKRPSEN